MNRNLHRGLFTLGAAAAILALGGCVVVVGNRTASYVDDYGYTGEYEIVRARTIGITTEPVEKPLAAQLGIDGSKAALVTSVISGRPAERAGVERFDVIVGVDAGDDAAPGKIREAIRAAPAGQPITLHIIRKGQPIDIQVTPDVATAIPSAAIPG